jgi:hypothetical protein
MAATTKYFEDGSSQIPGSYVTKSSIHAPSHALPRLLTW